MTITFKQAQELSELGVHKPKSEKLYYHLDSGRIELAHCQKYGWRDCPYTYHAYNFEELVLMNVGVYEITIYNDKSFSIVNQKTWTVHEGANITQALGNKLIHDIKSGIVKVEDLNHI